jgi:hypothetical protein
MFVNRFIIGEIIMRNLIVLLFLIIIVSSCGESSEPVVMVDDMNCNFVYTGNYGQTLQCYNEDMVCNYDNYNMTMKCTKILTKGELDDME